MAVSSIIDSNFILYLPGMLDLTQVSWPRLFQAGLSSWALDLPSRLASMPELHPKTFLFNLLTPEITTSPFETSLETGTLCFSVAMPATEHTLSWNNKIQRNCLELHACAVGANWTPKIQGDQKPNCYFGGAGSKSSILCMPLCMQHHLRGGQTPKPSTQPDPWHPYPHSI